MNALNAFKAKNKETESLLADVYSIPCQTSKMEVFAKIINS